MVEKLVWGIYCSIGAVGQTVGGADDSLGAADCSLWGVGCSIGAVDQTVGATDDSLGGIDGSVGAIDDSLIRFGINSLFFLLFGGV